MGALRAALNAIKASPPARKFTIVPAAETMRRETSLIASSPHSKCTDESTRGFPLRRRQGRTLLVSFDTDWLFPVAEVERVDEAMAAGVEHVRISSPNGHDTFLIDYDLITPPVRDFLAALR